jgi:hypothetical protein
VRNFRFDEKLTKSTIFIAGVVRVVNSVVEQYMRAQIKAEEESESVLIPLLVLVIYKITDDSSPSGTAEYLSVPETF